MAKSLKDQIHDQVLDRIIKNKYEINDFLKENSLAEEFSVSKAPVREALIQLCNEGVIRNIPRLGYQIVKLTERDIWEATQFRIILELESLRLCFDNLQSYQIEHLKNMTDDTEYIKKGKIVSLEQWWDNNSAFHITLSSYANNSLIANSLKRTIHLLWRAVTQLFWNSDPNSYLSYNPSSHVPICEAIVHRDYKLTEELLRADILSILETYSLSHNMKM